MDFNGKTAIITGAGRGIGAALAREFTARGARVAVADLDAAAARAIALETVSYTHLTLPTNREV